MRFSARLNSFKARPDVYNKPLDSSLRLIERAALTKELNYIDLNYPHHFMGISMRTLKGILRSTGLCIDTVNVRYDNQFAAGAFTNPSPRLRAEATGVAFKAIEMAVELEARGVMLWLGQDGFDYPFQIDYNEAWQLELEGIQRVADHNPDCSISIEYKPRDPRCFYILGDAGHTLLALRETGLDNLGIAIDFAHSIMAGENPAYEAELALTGQTLYGVHLNDCHYTQDDGLMIGSVHPWQTLEFLYVLHKYGYKNTIYFDTFPVRDDPVLEVEKNIRMTSVMLKLVAQLHDDLSARREKQDALHIQELFTSILERIPQDQL